MPFEAERFRHIAVTIPELRASLGIAVSLRDLLVLRGDTGVFNRGATPVAKPGIFQRLGATRPARFYGRHPTLRQSRAPASFKDSRLDRFHQGPSSRTLGGASR